MTPFGLYLRAQRNKRGMTQKEMADGIGVSAPYLSALEHGHRGTPSFALLQRLIGFLNIIWDEAEHVQRLATLSDPRIVIDTIELSANATEVANLLANAMPEMTEKQLDQLKTILLDQADQG